MQYARNGPRLDEHPVGLRHGVAGGLVGYKHGMRREVCGLGHRKNVAKGRGTSRGTEQRKSGSGMRKPVAMEWDTVGQARGTWPREVEKMP